MYNCTKYHTCSAVARVTKDRADLPHLLSTVENQLRRRRQLVTIAYWNVRTLFDREAADRPERRTALVTMELVKYNIDIAVKQGSQSRIVSTTWNSLFSAMANPKGKKGNRTGFCNQKLFRHKADRNATASKRQSHDDETTSEQGHLCYNYQRVRSNNDKPR